MDRAILEKQARLFLSESPMEILPDLWTSGGTTERTEPMGSSPHLYIKENDTWHPDPYLDDISLVRKTSQGLIVICGCCHAGILNTLFHVQNYFDQPIISVIGGLHLLNADEEYLAHVSDVFKKRFAGLSLFVNHCSGDKAYDSLSRKLGDKIRTFPAGSVIIDDNNIRELHNGCRER